MMKRKPELLSPAGSFASLTAAVEAGADAVYAAGPRFGARAYAENLTGQEVAEAIDYVHLHGRKLYLTVNTLLKEQEMGELFDYLLPYYEQGLDAVIVQDVGVFSFLGRQFPNLPVHISTQMTITSADSVLFFAGRGARRIILARELSLSEIRDIRAEVDARSDGPAPELECFVHGALCYCYSGQCLLSSMIGGRSGNRGQCAQPCRLAYTAYCPEENGQAGGPETLLSLKDLCTIEDLPALVEAGIDSFKIEGRMKQPAYVYTVTSLYRRYLDLYARLAGAGKESSYQVNPSDLADLQAAYQRRGYTDGYYFRHNGRDMVSFERPETNRPENEAEKQKAENCAKVEKHLQEKINGKLMLSAGQRATLYLECGPVHVTCQGGVVEKAVKAPLSREQIEKQIRKTGQTPFVFQDLELEISGPAFLPVGELNALRREGLDLLQDALLAKYRREPVSPVRPAPDAAVQTDPVGSTPQAAQTDPTGLTPQAAQTDPAGPMTQTAPGQGKEPRTAVLVTTDEQLRTAVYEPDVSRIYVDAEIGFLKETLDLVRISGAEMFLAMPYVFRADTREAFSALYETITTWYDGVLVRSWDEVSWLTSRGYAQEGGRITADLCLYVFNRESVRFFRQSGLENWTAPAELNARKLRELPVKGQTLVVYGYQPVMVSAGCIRKTENGCLRKKQGKKQAPWMTLTDRTGHAFAVRMVCPYCYNLIYNSVPLFLLDERAEIQKLQPAFIRLDFTTETPAQMRALIRNLRAYENPPDSAFTRGHWKRGVN